MTSPAFTSATARPPPRQLRAGEFCSAPSRKFVVRRRIAACAPRAATALASPSNSPEQRVPSPGDSAPLGRESSSVGSDPPLSEAQDLPVCVLSGDEAHALLQLRHDRGAPSSVCIDLGRGTASACPSSSGVLLLGTAIPWEMVSKMASRGGAWAVYGDGCVERASSLGLRGPLALHPVASAPPTLLVGGFGMHRFARGADPASDTAAKVAAARPRGAVLDVCTGLGYTAITAAAAAEVSKVLTVERDPAVVALQRLNPWSRELFAHPKIRREVGDAADVVRALPNATFDAVIHDPPALALAGELYGAQFYRDLRRVCRTGARLFHYVGNPRSRESGRLYKGVARRLVEAGFGQVQMAEDAFGVTAVAGMTGRDEGAFELNGGRDGNEGDVGIGRREKLGSREKGRRRRRR